jgi:hypothetical protein
MKTILATVLAAAFLISVPAHAEDKAPAPSGEKDKPAKKDKKAPEGQKDPKPAGGW